MADTICNMAAEIYHSTKALSKSGLDQFRKSPAHFRSWQDGQTRLESSPALQRRSTHQGRQSCLASHHRLGKDPSGPRAVGQHHRSRRCGSRSPRCFWPTQWHQARGLVLRQLAGRECKSSHRWSGQGLHHRSQDHSGCVSKRIREVGRSVPIPCSSRLVSAHHRHQPVRVHRSREGGTLRCCLLRTRSVGHRCWIFNHRGTAPHLRRMPTA